MVEVADMPALMNMLSQPVRSYPVHSTISKFYHIRSLLVTVSQQPVALHAEGSSSALWGRERSYGHWGIPLCARGWVHSLVSDWLLAQEWLCQSKYIPAHSECLRIHIELWPVLFFVCQLDARLGLPSQ